MTDLEVIPSGSNSTRAFDCHVNEDCNSGACVSGYCFCHQFTAGRHCEIGFHSVLWPNYQAFRFTFLCIVVLLLAVCSLSTYKSFQLWNHKKEAFKLKAVNHCIVGFFLILRIIYFAADPWGSQDIIPYALSKFLYGFPIYVLFTAYEVLLLYWAGTYHNIVQKLDKSTNNQVVDKTKPVFVIANSIWFAFELVKIIFDLTHNHDRVLLTGIYTAYNIYVAVSTLAVLIGFIIYGNLLYKRVKLLPTDAEKKRITLNRLLSITIAVCISIGACLIPPIVFYHLKFYSSPRGALTLTSVVASIEVALVIELLLIMKPKGILLNNMNEEKASKLQKQSQQSTISGMGGATPTDDTTQRKGVFDCFS
ncbi:hypothetical protein CYY_002166 [Polysphondylium violaceum]|uniref:THH1/TOM1/TOM3 domain-containing protein n=1 Tax=Polysphondylium violaceum TaxID=133409 RepID=A0A8J4Q0P0_9MYCE|nr:hypothetical protein CYY_002166 [Polysphondylium violaceum]